MSMILILTDELDALDSDRLIRLRDLGVTNVTLLEEASTAGILIQGWAFERTSAGEVVELLAAGRTGVRVLQPVMQASVSEWAVPKVPSADSGTPETEER